jgi:hypothetical protein
MGRGIIQALRRTPQDPFYRQEVRRCWNGGRYLLLALGATLFCVVGTIVLGTSVAGLLAVLAGLARTVQASMQTTAALSGARPELQVLSLQLYLDPGFDYLESFRYLFTWVFLAVPVRALLAYAVAGRCAATTRQDWRSHRAEQIAVTTVTAGRYSLSRLAGQLRGSYVIVIAISASLALVVLTSGTLWARLTAKDTLAVTVFVPLDAAVMLAVAGSIGLRFGSSSGSIPSALVKTHMTLFLLVPASLFSATLAAALAFHAAVILLYPNVGSSTLGTLCLIFGLAAKLVLGVLSAALAFRDARRACEEAGFSPAQARTTAE